ncbi:hypothetical protein LXL04_001100 [Taraxacum kok-saghyz]
MEGACNGGKMKLRKLLLEVENVNQSPSSSELQQRRRWRKSYSTELEHRRRSTVLVVFVAYAAAREVGTVFFVFRLAIGL